MDQKMGIRREVQSAGLRVVEVAYAPHCRRQRTDCPDVQLWWAQAGGWTSEQRGQTRELLPGEAAFYLPGEPCRQRVAPQGARLLSVQIPAAALERGQTVRRTGLALGLARVQQALTDTPLALEESVLALIDTNTRPETQTPRWLVRVCERLDADFADPLPLASLAAEAGVHEVYLATTFRARLGCTIGTYLRTRRLEAALRAVVATDDDLADVASRVGFYDQAHLTRHFRRALGQPPARFRQRLRA